MPNSISLYMKGDPEKIHGYYLSSLFHGVLMEKLDPEYTALLHQSNLHPFSQYVTTKDDLVVWTVNGLNDEAERKLSGLLLDEEFDHVTLKHRSETFNVIKKESRSISYSELVDMYCFDTMRRTINIRFITPTSFKKDGEYCLFPSERLIFQSLMRKFDACSEDNKIFSEDLLAHYEKYSRITHYNLRSDYFPLEGVRIPSFIGNVSIQICGPQQMINMAWMLMKFGTYSGVGIKCGLGMGAIEFCVRKRRLLRDFL